MISKSQKNIFNPLIFEKGLSLQFHITFMILLGLFFTKPVAAQHYVNLEGAQVYSTFKFSSKISDKDQIFTDNPAYARTVVSAFGLVYEYEHSNGLFVLGGVGMRKAGSSLVFNNIDYIWKMQYVDVKAGIGYQFNKWRIKPYAAVAPYYASLLNANQTVGQKSYDIKAGKFIKKYDLGFFLAIGFKATISKQISIFTEYNYILGLKNIETTADQYLYNRGFSIKVGLSLNITDPKKTVEEIPKTPSDLLADKPTPRFIVETQSPALAPPINPIAETSSSKNTSPIKEVPVIENKPEKLARESGSVNKITSGSAANTVVTEKKTPVVEDQLEKEEDVELVKTTPSNATKKSPSTTKSSAKEAPKNSSNSVSAKSKTEKESGARNRMPVKILFKIQIGSVSKPLGINHPLLKNVSGKIEKEAGKDGMIRYYSGIFESYDEARSFLSIIKSKGGNEGAFVVAFKNGKQITVYEAKKLIEENE
ncbi:MAG: outer membrane beta-barrel protein [Bacteroidota bacterium]